MRIALVLAAAVALALGTAGCRTGGYGCSACDGSPVSNCSWGCPKVGANCCGWDFYVPCDMIEGREARECGRAPYASGQVVSRSWAVPAGACPPPQGMPMMAAPPPPSNLPPPSVQPTPVPPAPVPQPAQ